MRELVAPADEVGGVAGLLARGSARHAAAYALAVSVAYYGASKVGFALTFPNYAVSTLWPPNSLLLAALLLAPTRLWAVVLLAAFPAHLAAQVGSGVPVPMLLCWYVTNCAEALISAVLVRRAVGTVLRFDRSRHVAAFMLSAAVAIVVTSFLDAGVVALNGWASAGYWEVWRMRCFSNLVAALTIVPVVVATAGARGARRRASRRLLLAELGAFAVTLLAVDLLSFASWSDRRAMVPALVYAPLPLLVWASVRLGPTVVSGSLLATALLAIGGARNGLGPFTTMSPAENVVALQTFVITMTVPLMFLAAYVEEHRATAEALRASQERLARTAAFSIVMVTHVSLEGRWLRVPATLCELLGYREEELLSRTTGEVTHPDDREETSRHYRRLLSGEVRSFDLEKRYVRRDGRVLWADVNVSLVTEPNGQPLHFLAYVKDITERKRSEAALRDSNEQIRELAARLISAQEEERRRIARDLHDDLNQQVAAVAVGLSALKRMLPETADPEQDRVVVLQQRVADIATTIRALSHELHSSALEHVGLSAALSALVEEFRGHGAVEVGLETRGDLAAVSADAQLCLYRVAQESLRNVEKHSGARRAEVVVVGDGETVRLLVRDDGVGFDAAAARRGGGIGLLSMEERVRSLAGRFGVEPRPGGGTELVAEIPVRGAGREEGSAAAAAPSREGD